MVVEKVCEEYSCDICGNEVRVIKAGGGILVCCGSEMEKTEESGQSSINLPDADG